MTSPPGGGSRRKRPVLVPVLAVLLATGMGTTAVLGGLDQVPPQPPPKLGPGDVLDQGQFQTRFEGASFHVKPAENEFDEEERLLDLTFTVTNQGDTTTTVSNPPPPGREPTSMFSFGGSILRTVPPVKSEYGGTGSVVTPGTEDDDVTASSKQLHPGVPTKVRVRYEIDKAMPVPDRITLEMGGYEYRPDFWDGEEDWHSLTSELPGGKAEPDILATVTLPVEREGAP